MELSENIFFFFTLVTLLNSYFQLIYLVPSLNAIKNLKEILAPSKYPNPKNSRQNCITSCYKCDICKNYMVFDRTFKCTVTGKVYYIKGEMNCESTNAIYLTTCMKCLEQYVGSAVKFKSRFRIHKFNIKTKNGRCGTARHFHNKCCNSTNPSVYLRA